MTEAASNTILQRLSGGDPSNLPLGRKSRRPRTHSAHMMTPLMQEWRGVGRVLKSIQIGYSSRDEPHTSNWSSTSNCDSSCINSRIVAVNHDQKEKQAHSCFIYMRRRMLRATQTSWAARHHSKMSQRHNLHHSNCICVRIVSMEQEESRIFLSDEEEVGYSRP